MTNITLIARQDNGYTWMVVKNPTKEEIQNAMPFIRNSFNEYLEYRNCGIVYRFVRNLDLHKYGIQEPTIEVKAN